MFRPRIWWLVHTTLVSCFAGLLLPVCYPVLSSRTMLAYSIGSSQQVAAKPSRAPSFTPPQPAPAADVTLATTTTLAAPSATCNPMGSLSQPSQMVLTGASEGLTSLNDPIQVYELYGSTGDSLRQQLQRCAPVNSDGGQYSGETSYSLTWQYSYLSGNGSCSLTDVKVGLHTSSILPMWQTRAAASPQLTQAWTSFIAGLTAHESGHTSIDNQYASRLTHDLQNLKAESCDNLASLARTTINTEVQALNQANAAYDIATNHGATQGAVANF